MHSRRCAFRKLADLKQQALALCNEHLRKCLGSARARGDKVPTNTIFDILRTESTWRQWHTLRQTVNPNRGGAVTRLLKVPDVAEDSLYATRGGVETQVALTIGACYKTAQGAPIIQDSQLHKDFGFLADTDATARVLAETYEYPQDMGAHTRLLLEEAHTVFSSLLEEEIIDFVTPTDFRSFWCHTEEDIQSSESGCHFGHYKSASHDRYITALHSL